jgi:hypothetical protein
MGSAFKLALISAFYYEDANWLQEWCLRFVDHPSNSARHGAAIVLGNVSSVHALAIDLLKSLHALEKLKADAAEQVRIAADDSMHDVLHLIRLHKKVHLGR